jgi:hypothetical protein
MLLPADHDGDGAHGLLTARDGAEFDEGADFGRFFHPDARAAETHVKGEADLEGFPGSAVVEDTEGDGPVDGFALMNPLARLFPLGLAEQEEAVFRTGYVGTAGYPSFALIANKAKLGVLGREGVTVEGDGEGHFGCDLAKADSRFGALGPKDRDRVAHMVSRRQTDHGLLIGRLLGSR